MIYLGKFVIEYVRNTLEIKLDINKHAVDSFTDWEKTKYRKLVFTVHILDS